MCASGRDLYTADERLRIQDELGMAMDNKLLGLVTELTDYKLRAYLAEPKLFAEDTGREPLSDPNVALLHSRVMPAVAQALSSANRLKRFDHFPADEQITRVKELAERTAIATALHAVKEVAPDPKKPFMPEVGWHLPAEGDQRFAMTQIRMLAHQQDAALDAADIVSGRVVDRILTAGSHGTPRGSFKRS